MEAQPDQSRLWYDPVLGGIDLLRARFARHVFGRHAHPEFVIAVFEQGAERFEAEGTQHIVEAGSVLLIPPDLAHTGRAATDDGWSYRAFYPSAEFLGLVQDDLFNHAFDVTALPLRIMADGALHARLRRAHEALEGHEDRLEVSAALISALGHLLRHAYLEVPLRPVGQETRAVLWARDYLQANFAEAIDALDVAKAAGMSVSHLMRAFKKQMGVPINVYHTTVRLAQARRLLLAGESAAEVAAAVGFVDQSHLIRRFRDAFGVTPGRYVRDSRIVQ